MQWKSGGREFMAFHESEAIIAQRMIRDDGIVYKLLVIGTHVHVVPQGSHLIGMTFGGIDVIRLRWQ